MPITVKHSKVSTIPDAADTDLVRPSDWNADHTLVGLGTMAEQNANAVAITGGTINGTTIGATTPSTVNATTITGQTGVLRGTGSNLITYSQLIGGTNWTFQGTVAVTTNSGATTDPLGGNTASLISGATDVVFNGNSVKQLDTVSGNIAYTYSVYIKAGTATTMQIALRDNSTGSLPTTTLTPNSSWQRVSVSLTSGSGTSSVYAILGGANGTFYAWGAQLEIGSTANTYIPTTTTAVYGTPTLSFSGVSSIGLESNGSLYASSAGTGNVRFYTNNVALEQMRVSNTTSAVNYVQVTGAATGSGNYTTISSQGSDAAVNLRLSAKGAATLDAQVNSNTRWKINSDGSVDSGLSASGGISFKASATGSQVNYLQSAGGVAGSSPIFSSQGSDTNIDLTLAPKNAGAVRFGTYTASALLPVAGYITIKDSGGTTRRLLVG
jgi:hypothetical protein